MPPQNKNGFGRWLPKQSIRRRIVWFLSCLVVFTTTYALILPAITLANETYCHMEEHQHDESCYISTDPLCRKEESVQEIHEHEDVCYDENGLLICTKEELRVSEIHQHSEECFRSETPLCRKEEHEHSKMCYSDLEDTETEEDWEKTLPEKLEGTLPENVLKVAESQLDYRENEKNFILDDQDEKKNYSRYGEWYGSPYEDWNLMFLSFVLHYSEVPGIPYGEDWETWNEDLKKNEIEIMDPVDYKPGDIVLFHQKQNSKNDEADRSESSAAENLTGIISHKDPVRIIAGDWNGKTTELDAEKEKLVLDGIIPVPEEKSAADEADQKTESEEKADNTEEKEGQKNEKNASDKETGSEKTDVKASSEAENKNENKETVDNAPSITVPEGIYQTEDENFLFEIKVISENPAVSQSDSISEQNTDSIGRNSQTDSAADKENDNEEKEVLLEEVQAEKEIFGLTEETEISSGKSDTDNLDDSDLETNLKLEIKEVKKASDQALKDENSPIRYSIAFLKDEKVAELDNYSFEISATPKTSFIEKSIDKINKTSETNVSDVVLSLSADENSVSEDLADSDAVSEAQYSIDGEIETLKVSSISPEFTVYSAESPNPEFEVQIYGYIDTYTKQSGAGNTIFAYNQTEGISDSTILNYPLEGIDNQGERGQFRLKKDKDQLTKIYKTNQHKFHEAPDIYYFNSLIDNTSYQLTELWVLNYPENSQSDINEADFEKIKNSTESTDWEIYSRPLETSYTNSYQTYLRDPDNYVYINEKTVIRLIYEPVETVFESYTQFFDYDISESINGKAVTNKVINGAETGVGINDPGNYNGKTDQSKMLAFGNQNTGIPQNLKDATLGSLSINKGHKVEDNVNTQRKNKAVLGLVTGLQDQDGDCTPVFNSLISAPDLFSMNAITGKTVIEDESTLEFYRKGDTYTLFQANVGDYSRYDLNLFSHPAYPNELHRSIWTNHFWPLDYKKDGVDPLTDKHPSSTPFYKKEANGQVTQAGTFPPSDNSIPHNNLFGMKFQVDFEVDGSYEGPLDYFFFGDDDLWVFVDDVLVADIGGVKQSQGVYVDLRSRMNDWNKDGKTKHRLTVFYTERGLSGSTCFMEFTLPSVSGVKKAEPTGSIKLTKVTYDNDSETDFKFDIALLDKDGNALANNYGYMIFNGDGTAVNPERGWQTINNGSSFSLKKNQYIIINYLPLGSRFIITEKLSTNDTTEVTFNPVSANSNDPPNTFTGTVEKASNISIVCFNKRFFKLPETGSFGINRFYTAGGLLMLLGLIAAADRIRKRGVDLK